jgi:uncharacterized protein
MAFVVAQARPTERAEFIRKTYTHVAAAVGAFALLEALLFASGIAEPLANFFLSSRVGWLAILAGFSLVGWLARSLASNADRNTQYFGLGIEVVAQAIVFVPLIYMATMYAGPTVLPTAAILTATLFAGLTAIVFVTKKDFSFLGGFLMVGGLIALGLVVCSALFGFSLGLIFSAAMVAFAAVAILYDTSKVMHHYSTDQYVGASLEIFASVALLFWYVLQVVMSLSRR